MPDPLPPRGLYSPWNSPGQNTGVGSLSLLQEVFQTQGFNPGFPHCRQILYQLGHEGSPTILEWVAYPFSSGSSWPGINPGSPALQADCLPAEPPGKPLNGEDKRTWGVQHAGSVTQLFLALWDPGDCSLTGISIHGASSSQEHWGELAFPSAGGLPSAGISVSCRLFTTRATRQADRSISSFQNNNHFYN